MRGATYPVMAEGAHAERALGHGQPVGVVLVLRYAPMVPELGSARLLRMQRCRQRVDFALELGDAAVGLLLALARRRSRDAA